MIVIFNAMKSSAKNFNYESVTFIMNSLFNLSKVRMTTNTMKVFDEFLSERLETFRDKLNYFSVLHLIINALKNTHDIRVRYNLKSTLRFVLNQLS